MKILSRLFSLAALLLCSVLLYAQGAEESSIGKTMRSNGRIYVVIVVMLVILTGLTIYLVRIDRKISKFEKEV